MSISSRECTQTLSISSKSTISSCFIHTKPEDILQKLRISSELSIYSFLFITPNLALLSDSIKEAQEILSSLEKAASTLGLFMNESKTKYMSMNISSKDEETPLMSLSGIAIDKVDDFVYLGSWVANTERDFKVRKAKHGYPVIG